MTVDQLNTLLENPNSLSQQEATQLEYIVDKYPYFQAARVLLLKHLKNKESYLYNNELKKTAAHTTDRSILFDYITATHFQQKENSENLSAAINDIEVIDPNEISLYESATADYDPQVTHTNLFEAKEKENKIQITEDNLELGKPLDFSKTETHSFNEWLQLTPVNPITREETPSPKKENKFNLIDRFIKSNPKISPPKKNVSLKNLAKENSFNSEELMTETLAKVYLEQKNYKKAKQAYRILSLKYPEKSSFFADRIAEIKKLENL